MDVKWGKMQFYIHVTWRFMDVKWENAISHPCNLEVYGCKVGKNAIFHPCNLEGYGCKVGKCQFYIHVPRKFMDVKWEKMQFYIHVTWRFKDVKWENAILHPCNLEGYGCKVGKCNFTSM
jgi:hypothetical protein